MTTRLTQPAIRRIRLEDADAWRAIRLRALQDAPEAFGSTYAETLARPPEYWSERAAGSATGGDSTIVLADSGDGLVGLVGGHCPPDQTEVRELISMWVDSSVRGTRLAERLVNQVVDWAALEGATRVELWVTETNERAHRFYERLGFAGTGARQLHPSNPALAEIQMARSLQGHIAVPRIRSYETEAWRATRLAALKDAPDAFGPTHEETLARPVAYWSDRVQDAAASNRLAVFAAVDGKQWVGLAGADSSWAANDDPEGTVHLGSIWIAPAARRREVLPRLLDAAYDWAVAAGAQRIALDVTETNERAIAIYERYGYRLTGTRQPLRPGSQLNELRMTMNLRAAEERD